MGRRVPDGTGAPLLTRLRRRQPDRVPGDGRRGCFEVPSQSYRPCAAVAGLKADVPKRPGRREPPRVDQRPTEAPTTPAVRRTEIYAVDHLDARPDSRRTWWG